MELLLFAYTHVYEQYVYSVTEPLIQTMIAMELILYTAETLIMNTHVISKQQYTTSLLKAA